MHDDDDDREVTIDLKSVLPHARGKKSEFLAAITEEMSEHLDDCIPALMRTASSYIADGSLEVTFEAVTVKADSATALGTIYFDTVQVTSCDNVQIPGSGNAAIELRIDLEDGSAEVTVTEIHEDEDDEFVPDPNFKMPENPEF